MNILLAAARLALGVPFVWLGYDALKTPGQRVGMAVTFGVPEQHADKAVRVNGAVMVVGGAAVAVGVLPQLGALGVAASLVPTTLAGHAFWQETDPGARTANRVQFLKNLGLIGGLLAVAATPQPRMGLFELS